MSSNLELQRVLGAAIALCLSACKVDIQDGVYACAATPDCPSGLRCDPVSKHCTRQPLSAAEPDASDKPDADARSSSTGAVSEAPPPASERPDAGVVRDGGPADAGVSMKPDTAGSRAKPQQPERAGAGGNVNASRGAEAPAEQAGASAEQAGAAAPSGGGGSGGTAGEPPPPVTSSDCPAGTYCYGFEEGPLDPSGELWASPSGPNGEVPPHGELTTTEYPPSSQNKVLVSRPSALDEWPKGTVGFNGPRTPFSKLVVSFDYVADEKLQNPNPRVILFRFVGQPDKSGDSVNVGLLNRDAMLEVQTEGADPLTAIGPATAPGTLTHVVATFTRNPDACTVEIAYGNMPLKAAAFPCQVEHWHIEIGLDMLETPPEQYTQDYVAFYDNLRVSFTP